MITAGAAAMAGKRSAEEMQEYIGNFQTKLKPHLTKESKVPEVGCGHGLLPFHLAPDVKEYVATGSIRYDHRTEPGEGKAGRVIPCKAQAGGRLGDRGYRRV
ncbi:hypothetical protein P7H14_23040 [Paenibacillus larvae]|nr:hypothetical protein [Paenibacillus larvae]MDT2194478.1 hypothetical protein [Paenibacillus larvae]